MMLHDLTQGYFKGKNITVNLKDLKVEMEHSVKRARASVGRFWRVADDKIFFDLKEKFGRNVPVCWF